MMFLLPSAARPRVVALALVPCCSLACSREPPPAMEKVAVVVESLVPALDAYDGEAPSGRTLSLGDVVLPARHGPRLAWRGSLEDKSVVRTGEMLEVRAYAADVPRWSFTDAIHEDAEAPTAEWMCSLVGNPVADGMPCKDRLQRLAAAGGVHVGYLACAGDACPIVVLRKGRARVSHLPGLSRFRLTISGSRSFGIATSHWVRGPRWTGSSAVVFELSPSFRRLAEIPLEEIDGRSAAGVKTRIGRLSTDGNEIRYDGTRTVIDPDTGRPIGAPERLHEQYWLGTDGQFVGR